MSIAVGTNCITFILPIRYQSSILSSSFVFSIGRFVHPNLDAIPREHCQMYSLFDLWIGRSALHPIKVLQHAHNNIACLTEGVLFC